MKKKKEKRKETVNEDKGRKPYKSKMQRKKKNVKPKERN